MSEIPNGAIIKDNQIYIPFDYSREEIPNGSIIYNQKIYIKFECNLKEDKDKIKINHKNNQSKKSKSFDKIKKK